MGVWKKIWAKVKQEYCFDNESQRTLILLRCVYLVLLAYYIIFFLLMGFYWLLNKGTFHVSWLAILSILATIWLFWMSYHQRIRTNLKIYVAMEILWLVGFVYLFGWDCGAQQIMFVLLVLVYFSFYDALFQKTLFTVFLFLGRFLLFYYTLMHDPYVVLPDGLALILQVWSSMSFFTLMGIICGFFSSNIETADKQLVLYNRRLREQASTDPLTGLWNRRGMRSFLTTNMEQHPQMIFSIGMGDIDFFKHINDQYGHDCGDAVLEWLTGLMRKDLGEKGQLCRWGGEEFLIFLPQMNGDESTHLLFDFLEELKHNPFIWGEEEIRVAMTFGVEEYDFQSELDALIKLADEKLYIGKENGRNQVVF